MMTWTSRIRARMLTDRKLLHMPTFVCAPAPRSTPAAAHLPADQDHQAAREGQRDLLAALLDHGNEVVYAPKDPPRHDVRHVDHDGEQRQHRERRQEQE